MDLNAWQQNIGTAFPIEVDSIWECKTFAQNSGKELPLPDDCTSDKKESASEFTKVRIITSDEKVGVCGFEIENAITNAVVSGKLVIRTADRKYRCSIKETKKIIKD